jgi:heptaprenyl diphosphate synthase
VSTTSPTDASLPLGLQQVDPELVSCLQAGLEDVEKSLRAAVESDYPFVTATSRHLVDAGGKRFRPLLALLAAQYGDAGASGNVAGAVVSELTHLATLYHDDVMDEAPLRRGTPSANARWNNTVAILTGDFLFARAADIAADLGTDVVRLQARTFERLCTGQIRETVGPEAGDDPIGHHLTVLADKTGSLIAASGRMGAMTSGAPAGVAEVMAAYGERFGVAFQLSDDLLDISSESVESGKTPGTDLREGVRTLPVLFALAGDDPAEARLRELLAEPLEDDALHAEALDLLRSSTAMTSARAEVTRWAEAARAELAPLCDLVPGPAAAAATAALSALCDAVNNRTS